MTFKCYVHDFSTDDVDDWDKHNQDKEHTVTGTAPCNLCGIGTKFTFKGKRKLSSTPCICEDCKRGFQ
jgi:hypothetical protein